LRRIASFLETESQIFKPYSKIVLPLPPGPLRHFDRATLVLRFVAHDAAEHQRVLTRIVSLGPWVLSSSR
jgi:hypothetical protein